MSFLRARSLMGPMLLVAIVCSAAVLAPRHDTSSAAGRFTLAPWESSGAGGDWRALDRLAEQVPLTASGHLILDARTAAALEAGAKGIAGFLSADTRARIRFLLQQALTPETGAELAELLFNYTSYLEARDGLTSMATLPRLEKLQVAHFGRSTAHALFHQQNAMQRAIVGSERGAAPVRQGTR